MADDMKDSIEAKILVDVAKTGFPAELRTRARLLERGWPVSGNTYYLDLDERKGRELDLEAHINSFDHKSEPSICVWTTLAIEVKKSDKPWVIFSTPRDHLDGPGYRMLHHSHNVNSTLVPYETLQRKHPSRSAASIGRAGYIAFSSSENNSVFGGLVSVCKAAHSLYRSAAEHEEAWDKDSLDMAFYTPVVVLHGRLFECSLDSAGETDVSEVSRIPFNLNYLSNAYESRTYFVDIVTYDELGAYCDAHRDWVIDLQHHLSLHARG